MTRPKVSHVIWPEARRIISTRHPPVDLFEDIADPKDWDLIMVEESKTNPRVAESVGLLDLIPVERRVAGPGASHVMAPFTHISTDWPGRFHDGTFGAYYAASRFETALAETTYHRALFYRAAKDEPGWFSQFRELIGRIDHAFHDIRGDAAFADCLNPDDYSASHALARSLRAGGSDGIVFPSVRDTQGECVSSFWPDVINPPAQGRALAYHFDGKRIDLIRDETIKEVFRIEMNNAD